jgi:iron complex outermembrane receptor protein
MKAATAMIGTLLSSLLVVSSTSAQQPFGSVRGLVRAADGSPAADAELRLLGTTRRASSGVDGAYRFDGLRPGSYVVEAVSERHGSAVATVAVAAGAEAIVDISLSLEVHREEMVVTASPDPRGAAELAQPAAELGGVELLALIRPTLGDTVATLPGVNQSFFGAGASRPVIRGIGGDRVRVLEDGIGTGDASTTSPDHAVAFDPLSAAEVEVVRGPATLLYGSSAVGGVVNMITDAVPSAAPGEPITGTVTLGWGSAADALAGSMELAGGERRVAWRLGAFRREEDDYRSGAGTVRNSFVDSDGGGAGASYLSDHGFFGASYSRFDSDYGNPGEPDAPVAIAMGQERWGVSGEWRPEGERLRGLKLRAGGSDYAHRELDGGEVATRFSNRSEEARVEMLHGSWGPIAGALGVQASRRDFSALGEEAFVPPSETETLAAFAFEEAVAGPLRLQFGLRYETSDLRALPESGAIDRSFDGVSGSLGAVWTAAPAWSVAASLARSVKLPNAEELFSNGPHVATLSFEIGDPDLDAEESLGLDLTARKRLGRLTGEISLFANRFEGYIFEELTGEVEDDLRVARFVQRDAEFRGAELLGHFELLHAEPRHLELEFGADFVRAELRRTGEPLPRIPAARALLGLRYRGARWNAGVEARRVEEQDRVAEDETPTAGHTLLNVSLGWRFFAADTVHDLVLAGTNLTDQEARNHVSFLKDVALLPGRDLRVTYRVAF